jgi:hypothetical protein
VRNLEKRSPWLPEMKGISAPFLLLNVAATRFLFILGHRVAPGGSLRLHVARASSQRSL